MEHLSTWQSRTILDLCDCLDVSKEVPCLCWRRDATRSLAEDRRLTGSSTKPYSSHMSSTSATASNVSSPISSSAMSTDGVHQGSSYVGSSSTFSFGTASTLALAASTNDDRYHHNDGHAHRSREDTPPPQPDAVTTRLLFDEARRNVLSSRYPCSDADAIKLAAILLRLLVGGQSRAGKSFVAKLTLVQYIYITYILRFSGYIFN